MSLLRDIQAAAIDSSSSLETLLRQCRVLASRLKNDEFKQWVQYELDGYYGDTVVLPSYRKTEGSCFGHFSGPFGSGLRNAPIPDACIPKEFREQLTTVELRQGVASLQQLVDGATDGNLHLPWPANAALLFGTKIYQNQNLMQAWIAVSPSFITGVLSTIRNRVLNFALEIEAQNPEAGEAPAGSLPIPKENVSQIFNNYIYGNVGNVASGQSISQSATTIVAQGDVSALMKQLKDRGINESDLSELQTALQSEPKPTENVVGPRVAGWMGKMVAKAADGTWKIGTTVAANLLTTLIKSYYGMPHI